MGNDLGLGLKAQWSGSRNPRGGVIGAFKRTEVDFSDIFQLGGFRLTKLVRRNHVVGGIDSSLQVG